MIITLASKALSALRQAGREGPKEYRKFSRNLEVARNPELKRLQLRQGALQTTPLHPALDTLSHQAWSSQTAQGHAHSPQRQPADPAPPEWVGQQRSEES